MGIISGTIGGIVGSAMKIGGAIAGGIAQKKAYKQQVANINEREAALDNWYDRTYNEDATQRADAQRLLTMTEESIRNRNKQAAGTAAVMGGTEESVAASKAAGNEVLANTMSAINAQADARKDNIQQQYMDQKESYMDSKNQLLAQKAKNTAEAVKGVSESASSIADSVNFESIFKKGVD